VTRADLITPSDANERTVLGFYTNLMKKDLDAFADLWADDAVQDMPFADGVAVLEPAWHGKEKLLSYYRKSIPTRKHHVFEIDKLHRSIDPDTLIVEAAASSVLGDTGRPYNQKYVFIFKLRDGKIVLNREHFNPLIWQAAFAGSDVTSNPNPAGAKPAEHGGKPVGAVEPATWQEKIAVDFYRLLMARNFDAWGDLFDQDAEQFNPFMPAKEGLSQTFKGREYIVYHYKTALEKRKGPDFRLYGLHQTTDPDVIIAEAGGVSQVPETGRVYDQRYVMIFNLKDGRILSTREYFNPLVFQNAFDGFLVGEGAVPS
jgi:ketosteroid isomerase-like protein